MATADPLGLDSRSYEAVTRPRFEWWWGIPIALVAAFLFWNPVGFVGGGADDGRYLEAARCWLAEGPCLPTNHWEARWPLVAPLAASFRLFGVDRFALALPSLVASVACLVLIKQLGDRLFGKPVGLASGILFGLLPLFSTQALSATVAPIELVFILGCFAALKRPLLAGLLLGLAFQMRETSVAAVPAVAFLLWEDKKALAAFALGFVAPLIVEGLFFYAVTGDPLYRRSLSVRHTLIASSALPTHQAGLPLFNRSMMENWDYETGVRIHWAIDGFVNLLINWKTAAYFILAPLLFALYRSRLGSRDRSAALHLLAFGFFYAAVLIYALSIDPNPRMMFVPLAAMTLVLGLIAVRAFNPVVATALVCSIALSGLSLAVEPRNLYWQRVAEQWAERHSFELAQPGYFALSPTLRALPASGSGKPMLLMLRSRPCSVPTPGPAVHTLPVIEARARNGIAALIGNSTTLCLYRYQPPRRAS